MPPVKRIDHERVLQLLRQGATHKQVCERLGINKASVSVIARGMRNAGSPKT
jgi:DNA-binding NarL/FixJ family response regulator